MRRSWRINAKTRVAAVLEFPSKKVLNVQSQLEKLIAQHCYLNRSAKDGCRSYLHAYASHSLRSVFDVHRLDLAKVAVASASRCRRESVWLWAVVGRTSSRRDGGRMEASRLRTRSPF
jgi:ATP-dependent RNA helicase DDX18/HAS1